MFILCVFYIFTYIRSSIYYTIYYIKQFLLLILPILDCVFIYNIYILKLNYYLNIL